MTSISKVFLLTVAPVSEGGVVLGPGEEHHVGEGGDHGQEVDDCEGEKHGVEECVDLCTACTRIDQLSLLPETRLTEAEAGQRRPPWRRRRLGAVGGVEGDEVQHVGDGADEGEDGRDEGDEKTEKNTACLDREDTDVMLGARIVIPTAGDQH